MLQDFEPLLIYKWPVEEVTPHSNLCISCLGETQLTSKFVLWATAATAGVAQGGGSLWPQQTDERWKICLSPSEMKYKSFRCHLNRLKNINGK